MFNRIHLLLLLPIIFISGCHTKQEPLSATQLVYDQLTKQAIIVKLGQDELYQAGAINRQRVKFPNLILNDAQHLKIDWQGDAHELLAQLALKRNKKFVTSGIKLPLPININIINASYPAVIEMIQAQIGYRALIEDGSQKLQLHYKNHQTKSRATSGGVL